MHRFETAIKYKFSDVEELNIYIGYSNIIQMKDSIIHDTKKYRERFSYVDYHVIVQAATDCLGVRDFVRIVNQLTNLKVEYRGEEVRFNNGDIVKVTSYDKDNHSQLMGMNSIGKIVGELKREDGMYYHVHIGSNNVTEFKSKCLKLIRRKGERIKLKENLLKYQEDGKIKDQELLDEALRSCEQEFLKDEEQIYNLPYHLRALGICYLALLHEKEKRGGE